MYQWTVTAQHIFVIPITIFYAWSKVWPFHLCVCGFSWACSLPRSCYQVPGLHALKVNQHNCFLYEKSLWGFYCNDFIAYTGCLVIGFLPESLLDLSLKATDIYQDCFLVCSKSWTVPIFIYFLEQVWLTAEDWNTLAVFSNLDPLFDFFFFPLLNKMFCSHLLLRRKIFITRKFRCARVSLPFGCVWPYFSSWCWGIFEH